jgi:plastocyanin
MSSKKNSLLIIIFVLTISVGLWLKLKLKTDGEAEVNSFFSGSAVVIMDDTGYHPDNFTVTAGTTVTFKNEGEYATWPASDLHPSHTAYPEFDPKMPLGPGKEWSFTFDNLGQWGMHDHLSPYIVGTINVVGAENSF